MTAKLTDTKNDSVIPFNNVLSSNGDSIQLNVNDYTFTLKPGKTYRIQCSLRAGGLESNAFRLFKVFDITHNTYISTQNGAGIHGNLSWLQVNNLMCYITPTEEIKACIKIYSGNGICEEITHSFSVLDIQEVGRVEVVDHIEYTNSEYGIEDTPVGHIMSVTGTTSPVHYLSCDGSIYNIEDYPKLTAYFREQFGSINKFGGDGTTTFAVPDLRGDGNDISILYCIKYEPTYFMQYSPKMGVIIHDTLFKGKTKSGVSILAKDVSDYDFIIIDYITEHGSDTFPHHYTNVVKTKDIDLSQGYSIPKCVTRANNSGVSWYANVFIKLYNNKFDIYAYDCKSNATMYITEITGYKCSEQIIKEV